MDAKEKLAEKLLEYLQSTEDFILEQCPEIIQQAFNAKEKMNEQEKDIAKLELLLDCAKKLDLPETASKRICNIIEFELDYAKRCLFMELGKNTYEEKHLKNKE